MNVKSTVLFDTPQQEIASLINEKLRTSDKTQIVSGFITIEGIKCIESGIKNNTKSVETIIVGAGTYRAYEAFDRVIRMGVPLNNLHVHLGHTKLTNAGARHSFYRYHPMLHSKIYYMERSDGTASVFVGSNNITGFALMGLNGEAAVLLEGDRDSEQFKTIRQHIQKAKQESINYSPGMKEAYSWWTSQFIDGLRAKSLDVPKEGEAHNTIVIMAAKSTKVVPSIDDIIYFELPEFTKTFTSLHPEVHVYLFDTLPTSPWEGLQKLNEATHSYWCTVEGLEMGSGGVELMAEWKITSIFKPVLERTRQPFRPTPTSDKQQVRVKVRHILKGDFEYLFGSHSKKWNPILDQEYSVQASGRNMEILLSLKEEIIPPENVIWALVRDLKSVENEKGKQMSPDSGEFIVFSLRRRNRDIRWNS